MLETKTSQTVLCFPAESDSQALAGLQVAADRMLSSGASEIPIDCGNLIRVTSSHIGALWLLHCKCREAGVEMAILSPTQNLVQALEAVDLHNLLIPGQSLPTEPSVDPRRDSDDGSRHLMSSKFRATVEEIDRALSAFREVMSELMIDSGFAASMETIFYEVTTNIREHSFLREGNTIEFTSDVNSFGVTVQFVDSGEEFDPTKMDTTFDPEQAIREGKTRGFGIAMVKKLADSILYVRRDDRKNVLKITKCWRY
jgi:anti-sigma regulatory factor (Ser/Thr protein kinase)/anti-anti-sigma regulatory factor